MSVFIQNLERNDVLHRFKTIAIMNSLSLFITLALLITAPWIEGKPAEDEHSRFRRQISQSSASASASSGSGISGGNGAFPRLNPGAGFSLNDFLAQLPFLNRRFNHYDDYYDYDYGRSNSYPTRQRYSNYYPDYSSRNYYRPRPPQFNEQDIGSFARIGSNSKKPGSYSSSSTFTSSNVNGVGVHSGSGVMVEPDGRVTTFQSGTGGPDTISTRIAPPGQVRGVFSSSSTNVSPDGRVVSQKKSGHF